MIRDRSTHRRSAMALVALVAPALVTACSGAISLGQNQLGNSPLDGGAEHDAGSVSVTLQDSGSVTPPDAGGATDASGAEAGTTCQCASPTEICVAHRVVGGAAEIPDDAGACAAGSHVEASFCQADWSYACEARPTTCSAAVDCACAPSFCQDHSFGSRCTVRTATASDLECEVQAPSSAP